MWTSTDEPSHGKRQAPRESARPKRGAAKSKTYGQAFAITTFAVVTEGVSKLPVA